MKATKQYFPVVLFSMVYKVILTFKSVDEILKCDHSLRATDQYFPVMLFIMLNTGFTGGSTKRLTLYRNG